VAFGYTRISNDFTNPGGDPVVSRHEAVLEVTYSAKIKTGTGTAKDESNDWLTLQPDFQAVFNPGGIGTSRTAVVAGLRCEISF